MVISIVAVLIAILLPALKRARATAQQLNCMANLKQMGLVSAIYGNDNPDYHIFFASSNNIRTNQHVVDNFRKYGVEAPMAATSKNSLFYCPADTTMYGTAGGGHNTSYLYWQARSGRGLSVHPSDGVIQPYKIPDVAKTTSNNASRPLQPTHITAVLDHEPASMIPGTRHGGSVNVLALDYHVEVVNQQTIDTTQSFVFWLFD